MRVLRMKTSGGVNIIFNFWLVLSCILPLHGGHAQLGPSILCTSTSTKHRLWPVTPRHFWFRTPRPTDRPEFGNQLKANEKEKI